MSDLVSAAAIAALPLVDMLFGLNIAWFVVLGIVGSFSDVPGMTAREVPAPMVARHAGLDLGRVVGSRQTIIAAALVIGPAAAGVLLAAFDATSVLWIIAATSATAALLTRGSLGAPSRVTSSAPEPGARSRGPRPRRYDASSRRSW